MPGVSKYQASFDAGQFSPSVQGRADNPRYEMGLLKCYNYLPIVQGPIVRRPGSIYVSQVSDSTKLPVLIPFQFSIGQNYVLEFGDKYIRFYTQESQVQTPTGTTMFLVRGFYGQPERLPSLQFTGTRFTVAPGPGELIYQSSALLLPPPFPLIAETPYRFADLQKIKWAQKQDVLYLTHPSYPPYKLEYFGNNVWDMKQVFFQDGPYLPLNSYTSIADSANIWLSPSATGFPQVTTGPYFQVTNLISAGSSFNNAILAVAPGHTYAVGDKVSIYGAVGTVEANNVTTANGTSWLFTNSSPTQAYWTIQNVNGNSFVLAGSNFQNTYVGSAYVYPALFQLIVGSSGTTWADIQPGSSVVGAPSQIGYRTIALIQNGMRYWGQITTVYNAASCQVEMAANNLLQYTTGSSVYWQLGAYNYINGFPSCCTFHQDRLVFAGVPGLAQEIDASMTSNYEVFSASGSNLQVNNNNALQFNLLSQDLNNIKWLQSNALGLLAGTQSSEWAINPSTTDPALYPTNIKATQVTFFGSYDSDAVQVANVAVYIQRAQRKVRELLYFWQVGSFRSTNLSELAENITLPSIVKIVNQKEPHPWIWGLRSDGPLVALTYKRDDVTLQAQAGWSWHQFGGLGDAGGSPPKTNSITVIPSSDTTYDEVWVVNQRYINSAYVGTIEYLSKPWDDSRSQELSQHLDCSYTLNSSVVVSGISVAGSCVITANNHGFTNSSTVRFYNAVGMSLTTTDVNGNYVTSSFVNEQTFVVASASTNQFFIQDFIGNYINTGSASAYVGSCLVNQLQTKITNLTWLQGETVSLLLDGGVAPPAVVNSAGTVALPFPAAIATVGYAYNSDAQMLRSKDGSAKGSSIGSRRRVHRVAFVLHAVGDLQFGPSFTNLVPAEFYVSGTMMADNPPPLFNGVYRDNMASGYGFDDTICFRQSTGLPGMIQGVTRILEEQDV